MPTVKNQMRFMFDDRKAAQAAAYLASRHGGRINYMILIKLLYLGDRRALLETGMPITGDRMVSMPHGTVLRRTLNLLKSHPEPGRPSSWFDYFAERTGRTYEIELVSQPETDELSRYELTVLREIDEEFGALSQWALRRYTHNLPEWSDPQGSSVTIEPFDILRLEGKSADTIASWAANADELLFMRNLLEPSRR